MLVFDQLKKNDAHLQLLALTFCVGFAILLAGLWWVQVVNVSRYQQSFEAQSFRSVRIPAVRGKILDRHGAVLAENRPDFSISLYLEELSPDYKREYQRIRPRRVVTNDLPFWKDWLGFEAVKTQYVRLKGDQLLNTKREARYLAAKGVVNRVATVVRMPLSLDYTNFYRHYELQRALPFTIIDHIPPTLIAHFQEQAINSLGVALEVQSERYYPHGTAACHVLGYVRRDDSSAKGEDAYFFYRLPDYKGLVGIEGGFDAELRGRAGGKSVQINNLGYRQTETIWSPAEPGENVVLTLDLGIQQAAENSLRKFLGADGKGAVVVMQVETGDVLALASSPVSDPNNFIKGFTPRELARWKDEELGVQKNRATREQYQAGSIFKPIVALAALENGLDPNRLFRVEPNPRNPNKGGIYVARQFFRDTAPPGDYDLKRAITRSSNSYFIQVGALPHVFDTVVELGRRLRLAERIGVPLLQETAGHFPRAGEEKNWNSRYKANISIGQGEMDVTPLQMAVMTCALANGGKVLQPRLVDRLESPDPIAFEPPTVFPKGQVRDHLGVSRRSLDIVRDAMLAETEDIEGHATGQHARVEGLRICGKTGTAEREQIDPETGRKKNTVWFISFAPYEHPRYAVVVMVENGDSGGGTCAPIGHDVYEALQQMGRTDTIPALTTTNR
jgi:penicillin-binding protein 2